MMEGLVSVIVPVYNVADYLRKCLDSILNQSYSNIEIILVNDGSSDDSEKIIKREYLQNNKVHYICQKNAGLSAARNTGITNSSGEYLLFVDSDDWIRGDAVEIMVNAMKEDDSDICICNMQYIFSDGKIRKRTPWIAERSCLDHREAIRQMFLGKQFKFHAPNKLFKSKLFTEHGIFYPVGKVYEDVATTYKPMLFASKVSLINQELYFYLQKRSGSITNCRLDKKQFVDMFSALDDIIHNPEIVKLGLEPEIQNLYVTNMIALSNYIYPKTVDDIHKKQIYERMKHDGNWNLMQKIMKNKVISLENRIRGFLIAYDFKLYCSFMNLVKSRE